MKRYQRINISKHLYPKVKTLLCANDNTRSIGSTHPWDAMFLDAKQMVHLMVYSAMDPIAFALTKMGTEEVEASLYSLL